MSLVDAILYTAGKQPVLDWLELNAPEYITEGEDEFGAPNGIKDWNLPNTPTFSDGNHHITLARVEEQVVSDEVDLGEDGIIPAGALFLSPIQILAYAPVGEDPYLLLDTAGKAKKDLAYIREYLDDENNPQLRPERFGLIMT